MYVSAVPCGYNFKVWVFNVSLVQIKAIEKYFNSTLHYFATEGGPNFEVCG